MNILSKLISQQLSLNLGRQQKTRKPY